MDKGPLHILNDQQLIDSIKSGGTKALENLYSAYRDDFCAFAKRYQAEESDVLDVYQDAIIAFYENIISGKLSKISSSIKTYLFSIGKFKLIDKLKRSGKTVIMDSEVEISEFIDSSFENQQTLSHRQKQLKAAITELGGSCKELLILFYYRRYSIEAIRDEMKFKNENTVKANKSRCMKSLRKIIQVKYDL
jgi:RNA polymerase sigma-70 factor (ECF subfamily)